MELLALAGIALATIVNVYLIWRTLAFMAVVERSAIRVEVELEKLTKLQSEMLKRLES